MTPISLEQTTYAKKVVMTPVKQKEAELSILVIDDDPDYLGLLSVEMAQVTGAQVLVAHDSEEAVELLSREHFELIVCDWALASKTAPDVFNAADPLIAAKCLASLREKSKTPVMFMSGSEKVSATQRMQSFEHFEPVSFILKRMGPLLISVMAENILLRFYAHGQPEAKILTAGGTISNITRH